MALALGWPTRAWKRMQGVLQSEASRACAINFPIWSEAAVDPTRQGLLMQPSVPPRLQLENLPATCRCLPEAGLTEGA